MSTAVCQTITLNAKTKIRVIVDRVETDSAQLDLFADTKESWLRNALRLVYDMPSRFYFSELRMLISHEPPQPNWWGSLTKKMKAAGYTQTKSFRRHTRDSRKGGCDFEWQRLNHNKQEGVDNA